MSPLSVRSLLMDDLPNVPARKGRAARTNPEIELELLHVDVDPDALDKDELRQDETKYLTVPAQSILSENESPDVPFRYSINPYRGCEHGCIYCLHGDTPLLMGDGRNRPQSHGRISPAGRNSDTQLQFQEASQTSKAISGIPTHARANAQAIERMIEWPQSPSKN